MKSFHWRSVNPTAFCTSWNERSRNDYFNALVVERPMEKEREVGGVAMFPFGIIATVFVIVVLLIVSGIKILREYQRAVIFRLGRLVSARGPGITYVIPWVEKMVRVELRTVTMDVPPQDVITRDNVSIKVSAVLYFRVIDPNRALTEVQNYLFATSQLAQVAMRRNCGQALLDELLAEREKINTRIQEILD